MLSESQSIEENTNIVVVAAERSEAATTTTADDRSTALGSGNAETVGKQDRRRPSEKARTAARAD